MIVTLVASLPSVAASTTVLPVCVGCPLDSLEAAVLMARPGDEIELGPGTWDAAALPVVGDLTVRATTPRQTFIAPTAAEAFVVNGGGTLTLQGLDLVAGGNLVGVGYGAAVLVDILAESLVSSADDGVVAHVADGNHLTIRDSVFRDLQAPRGAVAVLGNLTDLVLDGVVVEDAQANDSGGAFFSGGAVTVSGSTFDGCRALGLGYGGYGGALMVGEELVVTDSTFVDGYARGHGGFIAQQAGYWDATITSSTFTRGSVDDQGGALFFDSLGTVRLTDVDVTGSTASAAAGLYLVREAQGIVVGGTFADNVAMSYGGAIQTDPGAYGFPGLTVSGTRFERNTAGGGGAISLHGHAGQTFTIEDARFDENVSADSGIGGGAVHHQGASGVVVRSSVFKDNESFYGGAVKTTDGGALSIWDSVFLGNSAGANGGAVLVFQPRFGGMDLRRNLFFDNHAMRGGAVGVDTTFYDLTVTNCAFLENWADDGGAIWSNSPTVVTNSDLLANTANLAGSGILVENAITLVNDLVAWGTGAPAIQSGMVQTSSITYGAWFGNLPQDLSPQVEPFDTGNVFEDPALVRWTPGDGTPFGDDLHPAVGSPLIDAGHPAPALYDRDGTRSDIGVFGGPEAPIDADADGWWSEVDCLDTDPSVHPLNPDLCDGADNDCDGQIDEDEPAAPQYVDADDDGFGDDDTMFLACGPEGVGGDCDDVDAQVFPGAEERCNGVDDDCDDAVDVGAPDGITVWPDADRDGYGDEDAEEITVCEVGALQAERGRDCDDALPTVHPGAEEIADDGTDQDCDGDDLSQQLVGRTCGCDGLGGGLGAVPLVALLALRRRRVQPVR